MIYEVAKVVFFNGCADFVAKQKRLGVIFDERKTRVAIGLPSTRYVRMLGSICFDYKTLLSIKYRVFCSCLYI